jgi:hypothetical protein
MFLGFHPVQEYVLMDFVPNMLGNRDPDRENENEGRARRSSTHGGQRLRSGAEAFD